MLDISITEVVYNIASQLSAALLPNSDKFLRKASTVLIKMVGIHPPQVSHSNYNHSCQSSSQPPRKPKIRKTLQIHRINIDNKVRSTGSQFFETKSFQNFLHYHKLKYLSHKTRFSNSLKNKKIMFTSIQEAEEL